MKRQKDRPGLIYKREYALQVKATASLPSVDPRSRVPGIGRQLGESPDSDCLGWDCCGANRQSALPGLDWYEAAAAHGPSVYRHPRRAGRVWGSRTDPGAYRLGHDGRVDRYLAAADHRWTHGGKWCASVAVREWHLYAGGRHRSVAEK
jgi:hypothetical protein